MVFLALLNVKKKLKAVIHSFYTVELAYEGYVLEMAMNQSLTKW
jgi:hypothetical protein